MPASHGRRRGALNSFLLCVLAASSSGTSFTRPGSSRANAAGPCRRLGPSPTDHRRGIRTKAFHVALRHPRPRLRAPPVCLRPH